MFHDSKVIVLIPAKDEAGTIADVVNEFNNLSYQDSWLIDEIIVCDNGSHDDTAKIARDAGARVVYELREGYGYACLAAIAGIRAVDDNDIIVFIDCDGIFIAEQVLRLLEPLKDRADIAIGSRNLDQREKGVAGVTQSFGTDLACQLIKKRWHVHCTDLGAFRALRYGLLKSLHMQDTGYGWTVEMDVKALNRHYRFAEVPVDIRMRAVGQSKVSDSLIGKTKAAYSIFSTIGRYWLS